MPSSVLPPLRLQDTVNSAPAAKELFDRASEILGYDLLQLCLEGTPCSSTAAVRRERQTCQAGGPHHRTETNGIQVALFGMQNRTLCPYLAYDKPHAQPRALHRRTQGEAGLHRRQPAGHLRCEPRRRGAAASD
jgi:hypothetical protein